MKDNLLMNIKLWVTAAVATLTAVWGWFGWMVFAWALLMLADWLIGSAAAAKRGEWSSGKLREGAWHKGGAIVIVCVACAADWLLGSMLGNLPGVQLPFEYTVLLGPLVVVWYIIGELGSLAEHGVTMGAPVPAWLVRFLKASKKAVDAAGDKLAPEDEEVQNE